MAKSRLDAVRSELHQLRTAVSTGDLAQAQSLSDRIGQQTASAHQLTSGPAWWVGSNIPLIGTPLRTGRVVAYQAHLIGRDALPGVLNLVDDIVKAPKAGSSIDLGPIAKANTALGAAANTVDHASSAIAATDPSWLPLVSNARGSAVTELSQLDGQVDTANRALTTVLPMLGEKTRQRYFLGFMNEAESRGLGGIPGSFAILTAYHGRLRFTHFGSDDDLKGVRAKVPLSAQYRALYKQDDPAGLFQNSDLSPNFPDAARIWAGMWEAKSGQHIDGALAIDPSAISYLLAVTGPAQPVDGTAVNSRTIVTLTQAKEYALFGSSSPRDTVARKNYLKKIASSVAIRVLDAPSIRSLAGAAERAIRERRLVVWSGDPTHEATITHFGLGGELDAGTRPFSGFVTNNAAGSKLDFYLQTSMTYQRSACTTGATTTATLRLTNATPTYPLPPYVTTFIGTKPKNAAPGYNLLIVTYYTTPGAVVKSIVLDGKQQPVTTAPESGLMTTRLYIAMAARSTHTLTVTTAEPAASGAVQIFKQPAVRPVTVKVIAPSCN